MIKPLFSSLGLSPGILKAIEALGFEEASPIQAAAIPVLMEGRDVVGQSRTGSGKTAAFAIPAIEKVDTASRAVQVLILCPTRELAEQVAGEVHKLSAFTKGIHAVPIYGGASYERQFYELKKGVQIVIGTPGRIMDHMERRTLDLSEVKMAILDEADRMLDMGFREDIETILSSTPQSRQTVFFSATVSKTIRQLIDRHAKNPESIQIQEKALTVPTVEQWFYETPPRGKVSSLIRLIDFHGFRLGIIFCNTQRMVEELYEALVAQGFSSDRLHGGMSQSQRTKVMEKFRRSGFEFLVATDVAARGIDVDNLQLVVNFDLPYDAEDYVHRIGRTGRAGKGGMAVTFVAGRELFKLQFIERFTKTKIQRGTLPTAGEVEERKTSAFLDKVRQAIREGKIAAHLPVVERLLEEGFVSTDIAAALLALLSDSAQEPRRNPAEAPSLPVKERGTSTKMTPLPEPVRERKPRRSSGITGVRLGVGKRAGIHPKEILALLEESLGIPAKGVGDIELRPEESLVNIRPEYLSLVPASPGRITTGSGPVSVEPVEEEARPLAFRKKEFPQKEFPKKGKFKRR